MNMDLEFLENLKQTLASLPRYHLMACHIVASTMLPGMGAESPKLSRGMGAQFTNVATLSRATAHANMQMSKTVNHNVS